MENDKMNAENADTSGFVFKGRFSAVMDIEYLREKIAAHLRLIRNEKNETDSAFATYDMALVTAKQHSN